MQKSEKNKWNLSCRDIGNEQATYKHIEQNAPKKLTVEQLRKYQGYENIPEEEAIHIIETLYQLAILSYYCYTIQEQTPQCDLNIAA